MTPLLLLHGAGGNADTWHPLLSAWPRSLAIDLPGRGNSPGAPLDRVEDMAAWLADRLPDGVVLVGHSMGGAVALAVALQAPSRLGGVVLVSSGSRLRVAPHILDGVAAATPEEPFRLGFAFGPRAAPATVEGYEARAAVTPPATALADWRACDAFDVRERLGEVRCPVLVVYGGEDALTIPRHQQRLAGSIPGAQRVEVAGAGHMLPWEAPGDLAGIVQRWVSDRPVGAS